VQRRCHRSAAGDYISSSSTTAQFPDRQTARLARQGSITHDDTFEHFGCASFFPAGRQEHVPHVLDSERQSASALHTMPEPGELGGLAGGALLTVPIGVEPVTGRGGGRLPNVPAGGCGAGGGVGAAPAGRGAAFVTGVATTGGRTAGGGDDAGCGVAGGGVAAAGVAGGCATTGGGAPGGGGGGGGTAPGPDDDPMSARATHAAAAKRKIERKDVLRASSIMRLP